MYALAAITAFAFVQYASATCNITAAGICVTTVQAKSVQSQEIVNVFNTTGNFSQVPEYCSILGSFTTAISCITQQTDTCVGNETALSDVVIAKTAYEQSLQVGPVAFCSQLRDAIQSNCTIHTQFCLMPLQSIQVYVAGTNGVPPTEMVANACESWPIIEHCLGVVLNRTTSCTSDEKNATTTQLGALTIFIAQGYCVPGALTSTVLPTSNMTHQDSGAEGVLVGLTPLLMAVFFLFI